MFRKRLVALFAIAFGVSVKPYFLENEKQPTYLTVLVGHYVLLDCDVDFPQDIEIPHIVNWKRGVSSKEVCKVSPQFLNSLLARHKYVLLCRISFNSET